MNRISFAILIITVYLLGTIVCPPVTTKSATTEQPEEAEEKDDISQLSYKKYLREVMTVLLTDTEFAKKLAAEGHNISQKSGEIARHLDFVSHGIRTQLDEIKRKEVDRLRQVMRLKSYLQNGLKASHPDIVLPELDKEKILAHLDHGNPNTFEVADLARLIRQATKDLESIDKKRKEEFKNYEIEKEVLRREQLKGMDEAHRQEEEKKFEEMQKKHDDHPKLHHPGNEEQLKEVWEESDGLNKKDFDAKTFFYLHDTNGDGYLDEGEVEALFQQELDKVYDPNAPEDDMMERYEEMNRMREHFVNEVDRNKDKLINMEEFLDNTKSDEFKQEEGWEPIDGETVYSEEELAAYQKNYEERIRLEQEQNLQQEQQVDQEHQKQLGKEAGKHSPAGDVAQTIDQQHVQQPAHQEPVHQQQQPVAHQEQPVVHLQQQPVAHQEQPVVHQQQQPVAHQEQPVVQHEQPAADQQQPIVFEQHVQPVQEQAGQQNVVPVDHVQPAGQEPVVVFQQHHEMQQQQQENAPAEPVKKHVEG